MNKLIKKPLLTNLSDLHQTLERMFETPSRIDRENWLSNIIESNWAPTIDIKEEANQYVIRADVPGVNAKDIEITVDKGLLTIKGHKENEKKEERENYVHVERAQGSFYRSISLPNAGDATKITAKNKNGVLEITIPKTKESLTQKIEVKEE